MAAIPLQQRDDVVYPESDGQPVAETDLHLEEMIYLIEAFRSHFRNVPDVYVAGNLFFYSVQGNPRIRVAPDLLVVKGVPKGHRRVYKLWEEGQAPCFVVEVTSDSTRREDVVRKKEFYERLGVDEYFLYDPLGDYLDPRLQGFRLANGRYEKVTPATGGALESQTTGVTLRIEDGRLRLIDTANGAPLLRVEEKEEALEKAEEVAARETAARQALEEELARLRRKLGSAD